MTTEGVAQNQAGKRKRRGRETATDMVRSLGLVLIGVVVVWYFAQPPASDERPLRVVDPTGDIRAFSAEIPGAPVPGALPERWRPTSSARTPGPMLRVGYVTPGDQYAEYAASTEPAETFVPALVGRAERLGEVDVAGATWVQYRDGDGSLSLTREYGQVTVVVGSTRSTARLEELRVLAGALTAG